MKRILVLAIVLFFAGHGRTQTITQGVQLFEKGELSEARKFLQSSTFERNDQALYYLGRIAFEVEDYDTASDYFEQAINVQPDSSQYYGWLGNALGSMAGSASMFRKGILAPQIKLAYEKAVELDPENMGALFGLIEFYTQAPGFMGGSWGKAEQTANKIKDLDLLSGHEAMITVMERQERYVEAEREYLAAAEIDPVKLISLGIFYQGRKEYSKAFETFQQALNDESTYLNGLYQYGRTSALSGNRPKEGIESLMKFLDNEWEEGTPSHAGAWMRIAMIHEKSGEKEMAIRGYKKSLALDKFMEEAKKGLSRLQ